MTYRFDPEIKRIVTQDGEPVALVWHVAHKADPTLGPKMAAAPELYDALRELVAQRDAHFHTAAAWNDARVALAAAGETK